MVTKINGISEWMWSIKVGNNHYPRRTGVKGIQPKAKMKYMEILNIVKFISICFMINLKHVIVNEIKYKVKWMEWYEF